MKHIFILNPAAGNGKIAKKLHPVIMRACKDKELDYEIHRTVSLGDARNFTNKRCKDSDGEKLRFYACGGDGTINEVLNGLIGFDNAELAVVPTGTGNDFVRNFNNWELFRNIEAQIDGGSLKIDALGYEFLDLSEEDEKAYKDANEQTKGYALNMFNIGFDAQAVGKAAIYKTRPFISGTMAYIAGVLDVLVHLKGISVDIKLQDGSELNGEYTLIGVANGKYSGGGFDGTPQAIVNDGLMDISLVKRVTRRSFLALVKSYHDGTHVDNPKLKDIYSHHRSNDVVLRSNVGKVVMAIDGETTKVEAVRFFLEESAVNFVIPRGISIENNNYN